MKNREARATGVPGYRITSSAIDAKLAQVACMAVGVGILIASFWKLGRLDLTEAQFFFGVLLSLCAPLLFIVLGLLLPLAMADKHSNGAIH